MRNTKRLLALSLAALLACAATVTAEGGHPFSGNMEAGVTGVGISDDVKRVNEYSVSRPDQGATGYGKLNLSAAGQAGRMDLEADVQGVRDQRYGLSLDYRRILRLEGQYQSYLHWLDHDRIDYLDTGVRGTGTFVGANPLGPDNIPGGFSAYNPLTGTVTPGTPNPANSDIVQQFGRATVYGEDFAKDDDFSIIRKEWKNQADITLPQLPNVTFHLGSRTERREGTEQSIGMSKCTVCHITGQSRKVDEKTSDLTVGATGRFGLLTVNYSFLDREFREQAADPTRTWDPTLNPGANFATSNINFDNRTLYGYQDGELPYDTTPDSDKQSHVLKARVDLPGQNVVTGSYVHANVESGKRSEPGIFTLDKGSLETTYDSFGLRTTSKFGKKTTVNVRAKIETVENDDVTINYFPINPNTSHGLNDPFVQTNPFDPAYNPGNPSVTRHSALSRDLLTLGVDGLYRLGRYTSLRLGYEFQEVKREDDHFDDTQSHNLKASVKTRLDKTLNARASYAYTHYDRPFAYQNAALYMDPATGLHYTDKDGNVAASYGDSTTWQPGYWLHYGPTYGVEFYDRRVADLSNQPEDVHDSKVALTWTPKANLSATVNLRARFEENELNYSTWQQQTITPGVSVWYAPNSKLNLTLAYNYHAQSTESDFCQGWYDG